MPVMVKKIPTKTGHRPYAIVEIKTGRIVGRSATKSQAQASARARNMAYTKKHK
jgi:hypothetical protein